MVVFVKVCKQNNLLVLEVISCQPGIIDLQKQLNIVQIEVFHLTWEGAVVYQ